MNTNLELWITRKGYFFYTSYFLFLVVSFSQQGIKILGKIDCPCAERNMINNIFGTLIEVERAAGRGIFSSVRICRILEMPKPSFASLNIRLINGA